MKTNPSISKIIMNFKFSNSPKGLLLKLRFLYFIQCHYNSWFVFLTARCLVSKKTFDRLLLGHYEKCCQNGYEQFLNLFHSPKIFHCSLLGCRHRMALFHHTLTNLNSLDLLARFGPYYHSIIDFIEVAIKSI